MLTLIKNTNLYAPASLGQKDLLVAGGKIVKIADNLKKWEATLLYLRWSRAKGLENNAEKRLSGLSQEVNECTRHASQATNLRENCSDRVPPLRVLESECATALQRLTIENERLDDEEHQVKLAQDSINEIIIQINNDLEREELLAKDAKNTLEKLKAENITKNNLLNLISINTNQSNFNEEEHSLRKIIDKLSPPVCRRLRILESANLELAYVACGRIDAYYNPTDKPWDIAAAQLLIPSAGGFVHIINNPNENIFNQKGILAANSKALLGEILVEIG